MKIKQTTKVEIINVAICLAMGAIVGLMFYASLLISWN
jgi:hypothetical protein